MNSKQFVNIGPTSIFRYLEHLINRKLMILVSLSFDGLLQILQNMI